MKHCWSPSFNFSLFLWDSYFHSYPFPLFAIGVLSLVTLFPAPFCVQIPGVISTFVVFRLPFLTAVSCHVTSLNAASSAIRMTWCIRTMCVGVHILSVSSVPLCLWMWNMSGCEGMLLRYTWTHGITDWSAVYITDVTVFLSRKVGYKFQCLVVVQ